MIKPIHPDSGQPFTHPDLPDGLTGVVGWCGHRVVESEWRAGFRVCERDQAAAFEPPDGALVLRSYEDLTDAVLVRSDTEARAWPGAAPDERWFPVGGYNSADPLCWQVVTEAATRGGATLTVLQAVTEDASERDLFAAAIANVAVLATADLDGAAQIKAHVERGDGAEVLFYAGAQAMLDATRAALRKGAPAPLVPVVVAEDEIAALAADVSNAERQLPAKSIVADQDNVYLRNDRSPDNPWIVMGASGDGMYVNVAPHEEIDELIQSGAATVLRVGGGS